jgi:diketogulonate reductase-like aldo/keto reductase
VRAIAERHGATIPQVVFRFAIQVGMIPLTGTTDPEHMREDLAVLEELSEDEVAAIEGIGG